MRIDRRAALAGLVAFATPIVGRAAIYGDTISTVGENLDVIRAKGRLRVGVYNVFVPFSVVGAKGIQGIDADVARLIADRLGVRLELIGVAAGDSVDDDLRNHVWRGTVVGHSVVNLLLHVPDNRKLAPAQRTRRPGTALFHRRGSRSRATRTEWATGQESRCWLVSPSASSWTACPDHYLGSTLGGRLRDGVVHYRRPEEMIAALRAGDVVAIMGLRSQIEAGLRDERGRFDLEPVELPGLSMISWPIGAAVRENARDLGYAAGDILAAAVAMAPCPHLQYPRRRLPSATLRLTHDYDFSPGIARGAVLTFSASLTQGDPSWRQAASSLALCSRCSPAPHSGARGHRRGPAETTRAPERADQRHGHGFAALQPARQAQQEQREEPVPAWAFSFGGEKQRGQESPAARLRRHMYVTASYSRLYAIDTRPGGDWQYDARLPEGILPCCDVINRGAAIYGDKIYFGTLDATVVALDPRPATSSGRSGSTTTGPDTPYRGAADRKGW